jgi:hypothetical protein
MAVILYQIGIFIAIQIASQFGKSARNTAIVLITIFTLLQVFMSWLLLLQLITVFISYNFSKQWFQEKKPKQNQKQPNNVLYGFRENGGHSVMEVDLNDENLDKDIRRKAALQNEIREDSNYRYENDLEYKNSIDGVLNNIANRAKGNYPMPKNGINLETKFYYIDHTKIYGPVSAKTIIQLVKSNQINRNSFVRQVSEKEFEKRAYEIVELLE